MRTISSVGRALERHSRGHKFEPCIVHHKKDRETCPFYLLGLKGENLKQSVALPKFERPVSRVRSILPKENVGKIRRHV